MKCACGCGEEIIFKEHHRWRGVPKYIHGHNPQDRKTWFKKGIHPSTEFKKGTHNGVEFKSGSIPWNKGLKGFNSGKNNPQYGKVPSPKTGINSWHRYGKICLRSSWELEFAKFLDSIKESWEYESKYFELGNTTYTPDFYLPNRNLWIEIKGWWRRGYKEKFDAFLQKYPEEKIILIMHKPPYTVEDLKI